MKNPKISIIGCGNLGQAIAQGMLAHPDYPNNNLWATRRHPDRIRFIQEQGGNIGSDNREAVRQGSYILLGVKPYNIIPVLEEVADLLDPQRHVLVSLATGITLDEITQKVPGGMPIFRAMPNIAAEIQESVTCYCHLNGSDEQIKIVEWIFSQLGISVAIEEKLMEAATVLGACGIAYALRFIRAMVQGGIEIGFDTITANTIANQTVKGAADLLLKKGLHPEEAIDRVTTPKGCTIVGLNEMEHNGFSSSLIQGLLASFKKIEIKS